MTKLLKNILAVTLTAFWIFNSSWAQEPDDTPVLDSSQAQKSMTLDTLELKDMDINDVLKLLSAKSGLNIIAGKSISGRVTIFLQNVDVRDALTIILKANDLAYMENHGVIQIMTAAEYEQMAGHKFGVNLESTIVSLQSAKASDVVAILNQVKSQEGKVIADDESNSVIIQDVPEKVDQMLDYIKTMDVPVEVMVFQLLHIAGDPLVAKLQEIVTPKLGYVRFDPLSNKLFIKDTTKKLDEITKYITQIDIPRVTKEFDINYAKADDLAKTIGPMLTKDVGSIEFDTRSNTLVVTDIPPKMDEIAAMIKALDKKDKEVFIEAKIVQITLGDEYQMGVDWDKVIHHIAGHTALSLTSNFALPTAPVNFGEAAIGAIDSGTFNDIIQALDTFGKTRNLSSPRLSVVNNQEASILIGTSQPYATSSVVSNSTTSTSSESVTFIDVGIKLHVTPTIHDDGFVTMKIKPEISDVSGQYNVPGSGSIPIVNTDEVQTVVRVKDGVTIIIGGLMTDNRSNSQVKIPILGDIPIIGKAFSNEDRNLQKTEIVIFLTPHIINGDVNISPKEYVKHTPSTRGPKTYWDPLPRNESTIPVPQ